MIKALKEFWNEVKKELSEFKVAAKSSIMEIRSEVKSIPKQIRIENKYSQMFEAYCEAYYIDKGLMKHLKKQLFDELLLLPDALVNDEDFVKTIIRKRVLEHGTVI